LYVVQVLRKQFRNPGRSTSSLKFPLKEAKCSFEPSHRVSAREYYNASMARGWESKSVEAQQEEASAKSNRSGKRKMSAEEAAAFREKENLRLARQRVLQQLEGSSNPRHKKVLLDALAALDKKLA